MALPVPEPGLVISYNYLWHREQMQGFIEGRKARPAVIMTLTGLPPSAIVLPITHRTPTPPGSGIEIPPQLKNHLGMDDAPSWIIISEANKFAWPGFDLRKIPGKDRYEYGLLPPRFFRRVIDAFLAQLRVTKNFISTRD